MVTHSSTDIVEAAKRMQAFNSLTQLVGSPWDTIDQREKDHWIGLATVALRASITVAQGPTEPLQCLRCGTVDAFGPVLKVRGECICQDQHRRGYCTEPGCPYALSSTSRECGLCGGPLPCLTHSQGLTVTSPTRQTETATDVGTGKQP